MNLHAMVSLPSSVSVTATLKIQPQSRKYPPTTFPLDKGQSISLQKSHISTHLNPSRHLNFQEALSFAKECKEEVDSSFYIPLLQQCLENCCFSSTQIIHCHIVKTGCHEDPFLSRFLISIYAKCGSMEDSKRAFDHLNSRNVFSWTKLMNGYVQNSMPKHAVHLFQEMLLHSECYPSNYTLAIAVNACTSLHSLKLGEQLHAYIIKYNVEFDESIGNALCTLYSKCGGRLEYGLKAFRRIKEKNVISWTAAISACGENGEATKGLRVFVEMLLDDAQVVPNEYTLTSVLSQCCEVKCLELGIQVHSMCIKLGYESNLRVRNSLLYLYIKCGCIGEAQRVVKGMGGVSMITWNAMIAGFAQMMELSKDNLSAYRSGSEALKLFSELNRSGMKPDSFTLSSVLSVCSRMMALEQGEQIHAQMIKTGFVSDVIAGSSMVNMYNKCGSVEKASKAFLEMSIRTMVLWTSMINGFAQHGWSKQALDLFEDMKLVGVRPNQVTFVGILYACGNAGMTKEAFNYFKIMQKEYKIEPVMDHYARLVDMLVKLGQLEKAFNLIKTMDYEASEYIWSNLIAGCLSLGNLELGCHAAEKLLSLKPKDAETYEFLLKTYASAGRFEEVSKVEKIMKEEKVEKLKDWSWISIKDKVYSFETNDKAHIENSLVNKSLEDLLVKAKNLGYDIDHSEKLAIIFGLENLPNSSPVRVVKNTLMCRDCHNFMNYVSKLTSREIIVKDSKRLHKFVNGQCCCGNVGNGVRSFIGGPLVRCKFLNKK